MATPTELFNWSVPAPTKVRPVYVLAAEPNRFSVPVPCLRRLPPTPLMTPAKVVLVALLTVSTPLPRLTWAVEAPVLLANDPMTSVKPFKSNRPSLLMVTAAVLARSELCNSRTIARTGGSNTVADDQVAGNGKPD